MSTGSWAEEQIDEWCAKSGTLRLAVPVNSLLSQIDTPPKTLYVRGDASLLETFCIAVVGTRNASGYGLATAFRFAGDLARRGVCVVSGLARGVDTAAHRGTVLAKGKTIAVLGHGLDRVYPAQNARLAEEIVATGGCVVSEYAPGVPPLKPHFPQRNRIIAGLSKGVVVIEAAEKSGSLITARYAADYGREVFVPPGRIEGGDYRGSHCLIQEGARLVCNVDEVMEEFKISPHAFLATESEEDSRVRSLWQSRFSGEVRTLEDLFQICRLGLPDLLTQLEIAVSRGWVADLGGQRYALVTCSA